MSQNTGAKITVDGKEYLIADLSENARAQIKNISFCDEQIQQRSSEWAIADTARIGYTAALKRAAKAG